MADKRITDLNHNASPTSDALIEIVSDPGGTPVSESTSIGELPLATAAQGALAETAVQPGDLATVATSGAYTDLVARPPRPGGIRLRTGHYAYLAPKSATAYLASVNMCVLVPFDMDEPGELDSISINVSNGGDAASLIRLGVYTDNGDATWGDELVVDAGTVTGQSTGPKTASFSPVTLDVGRYWAAVVLQGSGTMPQLSGSSAGPYAGQNIISLSFSSTCAYTTPVSGALPSTIGAPTSHIGCPLVALTGSPLS